MTSRGIFTAHGSDFDLSHTSNLLLLVPAPDGCGPCYRALVAFGHHVFTRDIRAGDSPEWLYTEGSDTRCFCPIRYGQSLSIPALLFAAVSGHAYFSQAHNFMFVEKQDGCVGPYVIFFNLKKATVKNVHAAMFVVSAYEKPKLPPLKHLKRVRFRTLVARVASGGEIRRPK